MKKLIQLGSLLAIIALVVLLAVGSAGADTDDEDSAATTEPEPFGTATRIDFEFTDDVALPGTYVVQETGGRVVATWTARGGERDSGWLDHLNIAHESVYVQVLYYSDGATEPIVMNILNPAGGKTYGWLTQGIAHALEVSFTNTVPKQPPPSPTDPLSGEPYTIQAGDTLIGIGAQTGCSVDELATHNSIADPNLIVVGQVIYIPDNCAG